MPCHSNAVGHRPLTLTTPALLALALVGCATLNPGANKIGWLQELPEGDFESLGEVSCERGDNFRHASKNVATCRTVIRNEAHALGADFIVLQSESVGEGDCENCVLLFATAYRRKGSDSAEGSQGGSESTSQPTANAAGSVNTVEPAPAAVTPRCPASDLEEQIVIGLERRRDQILECTSGEKVTLVAAYAATGDLSFAATGSLAGSDTETCIREALGQPTLDTGGESGVIAHELKPGGW